MSIFSISQIWLFSAILIVFNSYGFTSDPHFSEIENDGPNGLTHGYNHSNSLHVDSPTETIVFNLPIIENNAPEQTPAPSDAYPPPPSSTETPSGTPTPTPIPVQTGSVNVPIVIGALAIITVILLAWFFIGYLPTKKKAKTS